MTTIRDFLVKEELAIQAWSANTYEQGVEKQISTKMNAVGGGGGGPAPERLVPAKGASLVGSEYNPSATDATDFSSPNKGNMHSEGKHLDELDVDKVDACDDSSDMHAVNPPGCEKATLGLKKKFGDSASTYKIAWSMKKSGKCG